MRKTPLDRLEELATRRFGRGTAVELDRFSVVAIVWRADGTEACRIGADTLTTAIKQSIAFLSDDTNVARIGGLRQ